MTGVITALSHRGPLPAGRRRHGHGWDASRAASEEFGPRVWPRRSASVVWSRARSEAAAPSRRWSSPTTSRLASVRSAP